MLTRQGQEMILFKTPIPALWPIQPAIRWVPGVQRLGFEVAALSIKITVCNNTQTNVNASMKHLTGRSYLTVICEAEN